MIFGQISKNSNTFHDNLTNFRVHFNQLIVNQLNEKDSELVFAIVLDNNLKQLTFLDYRTLNEYCKLTATVCIARSCTTRP